MDSWLNYLVQNETVLTKQNIKRTAIRYHLLYSTS